MTAPGENIEFLESKHFKKAVLPYPNLREKVIQHLESWPGTGRLVANGVRELILEIEGTKVAVLYRREGNRLGLMHLFNLPQGQPALDEIIVEAEKLFGKGGGK